MFDKKQLHCGDLILFSGRSFVSRAIKFATDSTWTHCAVYVGGGKNYIIEATLAGVEKNTLDSLIDSETTMCVRRIPNLSAANAELMKAKAYSYIYHDYDVLQLVSLGIYFALRKIGIHAPFFVKNSKNKMICSELFAVCALVIPLVFSPSTKLATPEILYRTLKMNTIYEGMPLKEGK